jgi:hypothetical protein
VAYNFNQLTVRDRIGVGTDTPAEALEIKGNIKLNTGVAVAEFSTDGTFSTANNQSIPTTQAVKTYTNTQLLTVSQVLANKADLTGALAQNFQVNNLTAQGNLQVTGTVTANKFIGDGSSLTGLSGVTQWVNGTNNSISYSGGDVEIAKSLNVKGTVSFPNSGGGSAFLTGQKYDNEASLKNNNVKLVLSSGGFIFGGQVRQYEFAIGETFFLAAASPGGFRVSTTFNKRFSIDQSGNLYCAGSKAGFVADYFVNRVGDTLEQGDVVVIAPQPVAYYSGTDNNIPILEVDLTEKAYDTRVCGIVARFVTEQDLPHVEPEPMELPPGMTIEMLQAQAATAPANPNPTPHALQQFAASPQADARQVLDRQMGMMVTLGSFAHCKVDADIAPIEVGDLLTTSTTKGHAQKVLEPSQALGTIVGKALAPLERGQGKIPVLVMLQ